MKATRLLLSCCISATSSPLLAQSNAAEPTPPPAAESTATAGTDEVVVTGTRIVRNGFQAPTPVTTLTSTALESMRPSNIPDALNQLPQFRGSQSNNQSVTWNANSPATGNYLNLRGLGTQRSLILLDGVRVPPTSFSGGVDTNTLPQALVERVDVVTGGASAAYGSDAVVGVVNFILNKKFTGLKGSVQGGISTYGDDESYRVTMAAGSGFADGRGHIEGSIEHYRSMGLMQRDRSLGRQGILQVGAGTAGNPNVTYWDVNFANTAFGGMINNGPLRNYKFLPDGSVAPMDMGQSIPNNPNYMIGGDGGSYDTSHSLAPDLRTLQAFGRVSYDIFDNVTAHTQVSYAQSRTYMNIHPDERFAGTATGVIIYRDNPYLLPSVVDLLGNTESFQFSRISEKDIPPYFNTVAVRSVNVNAGLDGKVTIAGKQFNWDANFVYGETNLRSKINEFNNQRFYAAVDAARAIDGSIVCRANLIVPNSYPGCVPINLFGVGAPSQEAIDYIMGESAYKVINRMAIGSVNLSGDLFKLPAGPLSIAIGGEIRKQDLNQTSNADPAAASSVSYASIRGVPSDVLISNFTNIGTAKGTVRVKEAYVEAVAPLLHDIPLIQYLEINGAARVTDYSTSGTVVTWKAGLNWKVFDDLRIRATRSRDIAAPSLYQLFQGGTVATNIMADPHTGIQRAWTTETRGNPNLTPEIGSMLVAGAVYSPSWLPGFTISADYYNLKIKDAIGALGSTQVVQNCEDSNGTADICANVIRPLPFSDRSEANFPIRIITGSFNQAKVAQAGIDLEMSYRFPVSVFSANWSGSFELRGLMSIGLKNETKSGPTNPTQTSLGFGQNARYTGSIEAVYSNDSLTVRVSERATGSARRSLTQVFVAPYDTMPNRWYTDLNVSYKLDKVGFLGGLTGTEMFFTVQNLFNAQPPIVADCCSPKLQIATNKAVYDTVGRYFTLGVRFRM